MNIFATSNCPKECAAFLDDKRVVKMCLETSQMLSTALYCTNPDMFTVVDFSPLKKLKDGGWEKCVKVKKAYYLSGDRLPAPTHANHPSNVWVRTTRMNYMWMVEHLQALCKEYTQRYGKTHSQDKFILVYLNKYKTIPRGVLTPFANCAANNEKGISFKHIQNVHKAYRLYLNERWKGDKRAPTWYKNKMENVA